MEITPLKELDWADLRIDTYRKGRNSGWLSKPDTCVRITHVPSGIAIEEEDDRSPHRNRAEAMRKMKLAFDHNPEMFEPEPRRQPAVPLHAAALKELAELVRDAHRYRKIKAMLEAGVSASIESRQENLYYEAIPPGEQMRYCVYPNTPVGSEVTTALDLDSLVDALPPPYPPVRE